MKLGYSEFSFGYAFTENLIRSSASGPNTAPVFPNLVQEAKLGYDVRIDLPGLPLFFQYKLPELMTRKSAFEISKKNLPGIAVQFFRMPLMATGLSDQHKRLIELEKLYPGNVFYASPGLSSLRAFNEAYVKAHVHLRSVFFSPSHIGPLPDAKPHTIAYRPDLTHAWLCSEPKRISSRTFQSLQEHVQSELDSPRPLRDSAPELRQKIRAVVSTSMREGEGSIVERVRARRTVQPQADLRAEDEHRIEDVLVAREMVRVDLGVDLVLAQPRIPTPSSVEP
jgi:hypothetical protein